MGEHGQLGGSPAHERAEPQRAVDDRRGGDPVASDARLVEEDLLGEPGLRRAEPEVIGEPGAGGLVARADRAVAHEELRVRAHDREAEVAVVEHGERRGPEALVRHAVLEEEARRAETGGDPALEAQVLAEEARLPRLALELQDVLVAAPLLADPHALGGQVRGPAVERVALAFRVGRPEVVEAAGGDETAAEGAQPAEAGALVERRRPEGGVHEGERAAGVLRGADVEPAVDEHLEAEAGAGVDVGRAHPAHAAVGELHEPDAGHLGGASHELPEVLPPERAAEEAGHVTPCVAA